MRGAVGSLDAIGLLSQSIVSSGPMAQVYIDTLYLVPMARAPSLFSICTCHVNVITPSRTRKWGKNGKRGSIIKTTAF